ncbi:hypothetical protein M8J76_012062 [Diaphorina citri]|nr:hypothetical protein M8J76_012062 [Diaphorina citri]
MNTTCGKLVPILHMAHSLKNVEYKLVVRTLKTSCLRRPCTKLPLKLVWGLGGWVRLRFGGRPLGWLNSSPPLALGRRLASISRRRVASGRQQMNRRVSIPPTCISK